MATCTHRCPSVCLLVLVAVFAAVSRSAAQSTEPGIAASASSARESVEDDGHGRGVWLDAPLLDAPFNVMNGGHFPSMAQSTALSSDLYQLGHFGLGKLVDPYGKATWKRIVGPLAIFGFDVLTFPLPFFGGWQHEEWHRAVMSNRGISSYDEIYGMDVFAKTKSVDHVQDADLARLTATHPAEAVRLYAAGIEANYELVTNLETTQFFRQTRTFNAGVALLSYSVNTLYWASCTNIKASDVVQPRNPKKRDFVGPDCTGWAYDLFHPREPYAARGTDPNGGVQRYQSTEATGAEATSYLKTQFALSFLNFLDPNLLGFNAFTIGKEDPIRVNALVRHEPTSFGSDTALQAYFQRGKLGLFGGIHTYLDHVYNYRPGLFLALVNYPVRTSFPEILVTTRADLWLQPSTTNVVSTGTVVPGGRLQLRLTTKVVGPLSAWVEAEGKTKGWAAGSVALDTAALVRVGLSAALFR